MNRNNLSAVKVDSECSASLPTIEPGEIIIGTLVEIDEEGQPLVDFSGNSSGRLLKAITTLGLTRSHVGRQLALLFVDGNMQSPVVMGLIHSPLQDMLENFTHEQAAINPNSENKKEIDMENDLNVDDALIDGNKVVFNAKEQIVLKCGESSITLTKSGKILIRGKYLLNRSTGVNRIMGGSVQVN